MYRRFALRAMLPVKLNVLAAPAAGEIYPPNLA